MMVKICGITNPEDALAAIDGGASALGFNFYPGSPRYVRPEIAAGLIAQLPGAVWKVGVFVNDSPEHARELAELLRGTGAKINLIAWNPGPEVPYSTPSAENVESFKATLREAGIPAFVRRPRGRDIFAACGQLKRTESLTTIETSA